MALEVPELASGNPQLQKALTNVVKAETKKIQAFDGKIEKQEKINGLVKDLKGKFSEIKGAIQPFKSVKDFRDLVGLSSNEAILTANVDKTIATPGTYDIEVIQTAQTPSVMTYGFPDKDRTEVGVGFITFNLPDGSSRDVYVDSDHSTLDGIAQKINASGTGAKALVVNDGTDSDTPWRIMIFGDKTGWQNDFQFPEFNFLDGDMDMDLHFQREAQSAVIKVNGNPVYVDKNTVKDVIPGVTLDLKKAQKGEQIKLEVRPDYAKIGAKAKNFVDKVNSVFSFIQQQNSRNEKPGLDPNKPMQGDVILQSLESRMRTIIQSARENMQDSEVQRLRDMGVVFNRNGTLDFDEKKFQIKLETNFDEVTSFMVGSPQFMGFANEVSTLVDGVVRNGDGFLTIREDNLRRNISRLERQKEDKTRAAEDRVQKARVQMARVEKTITDMQQMQATIGGGGGGIMSLIG